MQYCCSDLYLFYRLFITSIFSKSYPAKHIHMLSRHLMKLQKDNSKRLCVAMPPRHSKSSLVTIAYPLWLIFQNPNLNILIINNESTLSEKFGIRLREYIKMYGEYFNVYLSEDKHSSTHIMLCNNEGKNYLGSIRLTGAGGSITGQDADYLIIDDPYKGFDDITPTLLAKKLDWFDTIVEQRIEPHTRVIILHTRWHTKDLQGVFKKHRSNQYEFITLPALSDEGEPLWPEVYTREILEEKRRSIKEVKFQSQYQQKPIDDTSDFFDMKNIDYRTNTDDLSFKNATVRAWDIASSEPGKNDYTAGVLMKVLDDDRTVAITNLVYGQFGKQTKNQIIDTAKQDGVNTEIVIETGVAAAGKLLYGEWETQLTGFFVEQALALPGNSKVDRATPLQNAILDGNVMICISDPILREVLVEEFTKFPYGEHKDIVDASAHAYNYLKKNYIGSEDVAIDIIEW